MIPTPDLTDFVSWAEARSAKMILAGDTGQLQAVENGGAMSLLADALGYVQLPDPIRFRAAWEQAASLRLAQVTPRCWPNTTSTAGSAAANPGR